MWRNLVYITSHTKYISVSVSKIPIKFQNSTINFARFSHPTMSVMSFDFRQCHPPHMFIDFSHERIVCVSLLLYYYYSKLTEPPAWILQIAIVSWLHISNVFFFQTVCDNYLRTVSIERHAPRNEHPRKIKIYTQCDPLSNEKRPYWKLIIVQHQRRSDKNRNHIRILYFARAGLNTNPIFDV